MTWDLELPYTKPPLSLNDRMHWATRGAITKRLRGQAHLAARRAGIPPLEHITVTLHWVPRDRRKRDTDNPFPTLKACIDGLRDAGIVPDDDHEHVQSACRIDPTDPNNPRIYLRIETT